MNVFASEEFEGKPPRMDATNYIRWAFLRAKYARFGGRLGGEGDPMLCSSVKRLSILFTLPYWKVHLQTSKHEMTAAVFFGSFLRALSMVSVQEFPMRHVLDVMVIEKNIAKSVLKFLFDDKGTPELRRDLQHMGVRREFWLRPRGNGQTFVKPHAP